MTACRHYVPLQANQPAGPGSRLVYGDRLAAAGGRQRLPVKAHSSLFRHQTMWQASAAVSGQFEPYVAEHLQQPAAAGFPERVAQGDTRNPSPNPFEQLVWGITGERSATPASLVLTAGPRP
jgi:hypothetical protein